MLYPWDDIKGTQRQPTYGFFSLTSILWLGECENHNTTERCKILWELWLVLSYHSISAWVHLQHFEDCFMV